MNNFAYTTAETLLQIERVSFAHGANLILRDVNLTIKNLVRPDRQQGQVGALLGPSGAGKTTLLRLLAGLETPDAGTICLANNKPIARGQIGVVAQHYPLFSHRTVAGNLIVAGQQTGLNRRESREKARELLERFGLSEQNASYPSQLSGGQRQRAAIAQQFMGCDGFLLLDEPFSGLDILAQEAVIHLIAEMASLDEKMTFLVITHDIAAAMQIADTIWLLGRDRAPDSSHVLNGISNQWVPGARIQQTYDLVERGLAWRPNIAQLPAFDETRREIRARFATL